MNRIRISKLDLDRTEAVWLHKTIQTAYDRAAGTVKLMDGREDLSVTETETLKAAKESGPFLLELKRLFETSLQEGLRQRMGYEHRRSELNEVIKFAEEHEAVAEAQKQLDETPTKERYAIDTNRAVLKLFLTIIEQSVEGIRTVIIPGYETAQDINFTTMLTKSYYINKVKAKKQMLETLRAKIERAL